MIAAALCRRAPTPIGAKFRDCLVPQDDASAERIAKLPLGETVEVTIRRERSLPMHRLFFGILSHVAENSRFETPDRLLVALKIRLGRYDVCRLPNGRAVPVPQSISFAVMDQEEFQKFFDDAVRLICEEVLDGYDQARLVREVEAILGLPPHDEQHQPSPTADRPAETAQPDATPLSGAPPAANSETPATGNDQPIIGKEQNTEVGTLDRSPTQSLSREPGPQPIEPIMRGVGPRRTLDAEATLKRLVGAFLDLATVAECDAFRVRNQPTIHMLSADEREAFAMNAADHERGLRTAAHTIVPDAR